jgi:hypothetical protein
MGMDRQVRFGAGRRPTWNDIVARLQEIGVPAQIRMIDGQLAFPDETPADDWRELRIGAVSAMVTIRRTDDGVACVVWGNADRPTRAMWNATAWAFAAVSDGTIDGQSADEFRRANEMPETIP